ncbi:hypothetical protein E2C01_020024 [Portunus trituberculatus]|uniref:Uncharacterized protein n=1 Tax=Portunus trituberculatus TaxID=210409 RepID=A0A5B7E0Z5_PORTR|nr:hypothetical protein [Portunus trituberculatus]
MKQSREKRCLHTSGGARASVKRGGWVTAAGSLCEAPTPEMAEGRLASLAMQARCLSVPDAAEGSSLAGRNVCDVAGVRLAESLMCGA